MTDLKLPTETGRRALEVLPMTPAQIADLVERTRAATAPYRVLLGQLSRARHAARRAARGIDW